MILPQTLILLLLGLGIFLLFYFVPVGLWVSALASGVRMGLIALVGMRLRKVPPREIIEPLIAATKAGLDVKRDQLESHYLAGGNVGKVVNALIAADKARIKLTFERAAAIDLAGRDVLEAVKMSVLPKVITTPVVAAVAKDGIQLKAVTRVTVRANLDRLVGGATEETIIARVGEGIVSSIGSAKDHKIVLENPDLISKAVLAKGLDAGTAFEILSIDIADVDVGENIGAKLQADQAEADMRVAQAKAEERRAMAVAQEQENRAKVVEMEAKLKEAEAMIPMAIAKAFENGNLGIMDYLRIKNIESDTQMRSAISESSRKKEK
ncbi:MAG: flotillin-like protein FloA [Leptospiraceae bacterium]|nr:flotillin-like protein FloA [Leptospiraceae bacterium]